MGQSIIISPIFLFCIQTRNHSTFSKSHVRCGDGEASPMGLSKKEREEEERQLNCSLPRNLQRCLCHHDLWSFGPSISPKLCWMERANTVPTFSGTVIGHNSATRLAFHEAFLHSWTTTHTRPRLYETLRFPVHLFFPEQAYLSWSMCERYLFGGSSPLSLFPGLRPLKEHKTVTSCRIYL